MSAISQQTLVAQLRARFNGRVIEHTDATAPHLTDYRKRWTGTTLAVAQPDTTEDVAAVVRWWGAHGVEIFAQGGNTGLVGAVCRTPTVTAWSCRLPA